MFNWEILWYIKSNGRAYGMKDSYWNRMRDDKIVKNADDQVVVVVVVERGFTRQITMLNNIIV